MFEVEGSMMARISTKQSKTKKAWLSKKQLKLFHRPFQGIKASVKVEINPHRILYTPSVSV